MIATPPAAIVQHAAVTNWSGTYKLPATADRVAITVQLRGRTATVSLGPGHAGATAVAVTRHGAKVRFRLAGMPDNVVLDGTMTGTRLAGAVTQGTLRGTFMLGPGSARIVGLLGTYRSHAGAAVAVLAADGLAPFLIELPSGSTHGIGTDLTVGNRLGDKTGNGTIAIDATGFSWHGTHYARVRFAQREVRVGLDAATLTLPRGLGPFPAVAMVHGAGPRTRDEFDIFTSYLALNGIAVLADDKRGVGESRGPYPGDSASSANIDLLAYDAQAEVRFLTRLPQIDRTRIGLFGDSQAGWIIPLAASREPDVRWGLMNSGPTATVGETDYWAQLAGESMTPPTASRSKMLADVRRAGPSGFDPRSLLRRLKIPLLWMFGSDDRNVPTELCLERLDAVKAGHDYTAVVLPTAHTPLILPDGLLSSLPRSPGFDARFFPSIADWLHRERLN